MVYVYLRCSCRPGEGRKARLVEYLVLVLCYSGLHYHARQMLVPAKHDKEITFKRAQTPAWIIAGM